MSQIWQLFFDRNNQIMVSGSGSNNPLTFPILLHNARPFIRLKTLDLDPSRGGLSPYVGVDPSTLSATVSIFDQTASTLLARKVLDGDDATNLWKTGLLNMNTSEMAIAIGSSLQMTAYFVLNVTDADNGLSGVISPITIKRNLNTDGTPQPVEGETFLTEAQCLALFLKKFNDAGVTVTLQSPSGTHTRTIGIDDDGNPTDQLT